MRIVFTPLIAGKPWTGSTIYEDSLGGSESAVIYLARELARRGHEVTVFTHGQPGVFEKVEYRSVTELQLGLPQCDVHVSSRWVEVLASSTAPFKVLWLHDMPSGRYDVLPAHLVVCISHFQRSAWGLPDPRTTNTVAVIGDGVDLTLFSGSERRDTNRLLWTSNPDRGLYIASRVFVKEILPRWPEMELHVFGRYSVYGWPPESELWYLPPPEWVRSKENPDGPIVLHEPLPRLGLARELMRSWALFYPTFWPEVFCMAALEAQAAGTPVISSPIAALTETVKGGVLTNDLVNAISQLRNVSRWRKLSAAGRDFASKFDWSIIAVKWEQAIERRMEEG